MRDLILPRISSMPSVELDDSAGIEAIELAASVGLDLDPWQQHALRQGMAEQLDGSGAVTGWASFEVAAVVGRQNGKGAILEARELAGLFLLGEQMILHSSHQFKTTSEAFRRVLSLIENSDALRKRVKTVTRSHGDEGIELLTGQRLRFVARSRTSGRGFTGSCIVLDEAFELDAADMAALLPTLAAVRNPQVWYMSSAGMRSSSQLAAVRDRGMRGDDPSLCYMEWSAPADADLDDRDAWRAANPAIGIRISESFIERERAALADAEFARERLGIWESTAGSDVIDAACWARSADASSAALDPVAFAIDVAPDSVSASISCAGFRSDGRVHIETIAADSGTAWVAPRIAALIERWKPSGVVIDGKSAAVALLDGLKASGANVIVTGSDDLASACQSFQSYANQDQLRHLDEGALNAALLNAKRRALGERWAWSRKGSHADITPLVAATLALHGLLTAGSTDILDSVW